MGINPSRPECSASSCLNQVIGLSGINGIDGINQYQACVSKFGTPSVTVVTPTVSTVYVTETNTIPYTDVTIEVNTAYETVSETVVSYSDVLETVTQYTGTFTSTISTTTTLTPVTKRNVKKRGCKPIPTTSSRGCKPIPTTSSATSSAPTISSSSSAVEPATSSESASSTSSDVASSTSSDIATSTSEEATSSVTSAITTATSSDTTSSPTSDVTSSTTIPPLFPIASNCPTLEQYSSACSCIYAVDSTSTFYPETPTETITVTQAATETSVTTSTAVVISTVTSTFVDAETRTITLTELDISSTTTTATSTAVAAATTISSFLQFANGPRVNSYLFTSNSYVQFTTVASQALIFAIPAAGGQISLAGQPTVKLYAHQSSPVVSALYFETDASAASFNDPAVTCSFDSAGLISCGIPSKGYTTMYNCGAYLYLGVPYWPQTGCTIVKLKTQSL